ncbi:MAG: rhodanese-like domain-containing protein [Acidiferrobacteraceae bacterium]
MRAITAQELKERLEAADPPIVLDVREPWEYALCKLPGARHIPMREIPQRLAELPAEGEIVVLCHHGVRSLQVATFLERQGFSRLYNLTGGVDAWARDVDPGMAVY